MNSIVFDAMRIAPELAKVGEAVAGTHREKQIVEIIKKFVEDYVDNIYTEPVEVLSWDEEFCLVYIDGVPHRCSIHPPYEGYVDLEVSVKDLVYVKEFRDVDKLSKVIEDKVVVVEDVDDPNYVAIYAYTLRRYNPTAIVFIDRINTLRKITAVDDVLSRYSSLPLPKVPAVHVKRETGLELRLRSDGKVRIVIKSNIKPSYGFNVLVEVNGRDVGTAYLTAHHDRWFNSLIDDSLGIAILLSLIKSEFLGRSIRTNIVLAFFTAEEGFPNPLSSFYWLVGSRYHIVKNIEKILNEVNLVINLDVVYRGRTVFSTSNIIARGMLIKAGVDTKDIEHDSMLFDSFSFTLVGVPSITVHNYYNALKDGIYHSTLDSVDLLRWISVEHLVNVIHKVSNVLKNYYEVSRSLKVVEVLDPGIRLLAQELAQTSFPLEFVFNLYKMFQNLTNSSNAFKIFRLLPALHRAMTTTYISKSIYYGEEIYEKTSYLTCLDNVVYLPLGVEMDRGECYKSLLRNLESLTYILRC